MTFEVHSLAGGDAQELLHLRQKACILIADLVVRVHVELDLADLAIVAIGPSHALKGKCLVPVGLDADVQVVARQPGRNLERMGGRRE
jgi:hypothetical protein